MHTDTLATVEPRTLWPFDVLRSDTMTLRLRIVELRKGSCGLGQ